MNIIQIKERVDFYLDRPRNPAYYFNDLNKAIRGAIKIEVDECIGPEDLNAKQRQVYFQSKTQIRDNISTLIKTPPLTVIPTGNLIAKPTDYYFLVRMEATIDGDTNEVMPTTYNEIGDLKKNPHRKPSNEYPFYNENATGWEVYRDSSGLFTAAYLTYIRKWAEVYVGVESDLINEGAGVLVNATNYTATEESIHNSIKYNPGDQFVSANTNLTSGQVILTSKLVNCDLPDKTHENIAKTAASILSGVTSDFNKSGYIEKESMKK